VVRFKSALSNHYRNQQRQQAVSYIQGRKLPWIALIVRPFHQSFYFIFQDKFFLKKTQRNRLPSQQIMWYAHFLKRRAFVVRKSIARTPRNYNGTGITARRISDILPIILSQIGESLQDRPDLILESWPGIVGQQIATMTQAITFQEGVLTVKVKNSTLYSLLSQNDKPRILNLLRKKFSKVTIKNIVFRIG